VNSVPADQGDVRPIETVTAYRGVYWNAGPDLNAVIGHAAADRLRFDERDGAGFGDRTESRPAPASRVPSSARDSIAARRRCGAWRSANSRPRGAHAAARSPAAAAPPRPRRRPRRDRV
jgi:hypothetical protein